MYSRAFVTALLTLAVFTPTPGQSQVRDHLKCYQVKDTALKAKYTADLDGLLPDAGCEIKVPAALLCVDTQKTNVTPAPPGARSPGAAKRYACYKVKCPKNTATPPVVQFKDQFGNRPMQPKVPKLVCAPEEGAATAAPPCTGLGSSCACGTGSGVCGPYSGGLGCFQLASVGGSCTSDTQCTGGKLCVTSPGNACALPCP